MSLPASTEGTVAPTPVGDAGNNSLHAFLRRLANAGSLEEVMAVVSRCTRSILQADGATFVLRDGERCYYADEDAISPLWKGRRFPMSACISGWCMAKGEAVAIPDIYEDDRIPADAYRPTFVRSLAMAPVGHDDAIAALGAYWSEKRVPTPWELAQLKAIADATALAVSRVQLRPAAPVCRSDAAPAVARPDRRLPWRGFSVDRLSPRRYLARVRRGSLSPLEAYGFGALCVVVATLLRVGVTATGVHGLVMYSTYYPATVLAMLVGGRRAGSFAAALGGLAAYYFFMPPLYQSAPITASDILNLALYVGSSALIILSIHRYQRAVSRLREEDARHLTLAREERHRLRNAVFVAELIVQQSLSDLPERAKTICQRLRGSQKEIDDRDDLDPVSLRDLLIAELQGHDLARFDLEHAEDEAFSGRARSLVSLAVHELTTNALKYGALSDPAGRVTITSLTDRGRTKINWSESGGPPVQPPRRRGYGTAMLRRLVEGAGGSLVLDYRPSGLSAELVLSSAHG